jgi:hypothetical protein
MNMANGRFSQREDEAGRLRPLMSKRLAPRERWLIPACDSALLLPASTLAAGIDGEPTSVSAALQDNGQPLLLNSAQSLLYEHIEALRKILGLTTDDLLTPSMVWMTYSSGEPLGEGSKVTAA